MSRTKQVPAYTVERQNYSGVQQTVKYMVEFIRQGQTRPEVRDYAVGVIREVYPHATTSEIAAIYFDLCRRLRYTRDPATSEMLHQAQVTLKNMAGDCDDMAVALGALVQSLPERGRTPSTLGAVNASVGAPVEVVTVGFDQRGAEHTHTFVRVWDSQSARWIVLDPVAGPMVPSMLKRISTYKTRET